MRSTLIALSMTLAGCVVSRAVSIGPPQHAKPLGCPIHVAVEAPEDLMAKYVRVGSVCVARNAGLGPPEKIGDAVMHAGGERDELFGRACALGGEVVAVSGTCAIDRTSAVEFAVLRAR